MCACTLHEDSAALKRTTMVCKRHLLGALQKTSHISLMPQSPTGLSERLMLVSCSARHAGDCDSIFATLSPLPQLRFFTENLPADPSFLVVLSAVDSRDPLSTPAQQCGISRRTDASVRWLRVRLITCSSQCGDHMASTSMRRSQSLKALCAKCSSRNCGLLRSSSYRAKLSATCAPELAEQGHF